VKFVRRALVPSGVLEQILLVIVLRVIPGPRFFYGRDNLLPFGSKMFLLHLLRYTTGNRLLLWRVEEDRRTVLGAVICALGVERRWVMGAIEILNKLIICDLAGIKFDAQCLGMVCVSRTDLMIGRLCNL